MTRAALRGMIFAIVSFITATGPTWAEDALHVVMSQMSTALPYSVSLLDLALSKSGQPYQLDIHSDSAHYPQKRAFEKLIDPEQSEFNLLVAGTSRENERIARAIYIPLTRGLLGARVMAIPKGSQPLFTNITALEDLKPLSFLQGVGWGDIAILEQAGLTVISSPKSFLYKMLEAQRGDAFPRGAIEILSEQRENAGLSYDIEQDLLLLYDHFPLFFFTSYHNDALAKAIERGLHAAYEDGSFMAFFDNHPMIRDVFSHLHLGQRRVFKIANPQLTNAAAAIPAKYWHDFNQMN